MKAIIIDAPQSIRIGDWQDQKPAAGEVLISTRATGVCAGDLYIYEGKNPYATYPQVPGHEIAGTVLEVGTGVQGFSRGDPVVVEPFVGCGTCYPCRIGKSNCCVNLRIIGVHSPGGFGEQVIAPAKNLHHIPDGLSFIEASFAEPVAIGIQACRRGNIKAGDYTLVLGCGPIGLAIIEVARAKGARVVATDINKNRMETAAKFGAEILPSGDALFSSVLDHTNGEGAEVVVEATGNEKAMEQAFDLVVPGGRVVIVGLVKEGTYVTLPGLDFTRKEMTILGSRASVRCFPESLELLASGAIKYPKIATVIDMWQGPQAISDLVSNPSKYHKLVLERRDP